MALGLLIKAIMTVFSFMSNSYALHGAHRWGRNLAFLVASAVLLMSCTHAPQYAWGSYETLVYQMYHKPELATPQTQVTRLEKDLIQMKRKGYMPGPGIYAHLGYMYFSLRELDLAESAFREELRLFPESQVFIERLLSGLSQARLNNNAATSSINQNFISLDDKENKRAH